MAFKARHDKAKGELGAEGTKALVNVGARRDIINSTIRDVRGIDGKIKTLQAERREIINKRIKGDLDLKVADFSAVMRLAGLEDEDRNKFLDTLRETFEAVGIGTQLNFLDATDKTDRKSSAAHAEDDDEDTITAAGREAGLEGKSANTNPHRKGSKDQKAWHAGWLQGQSQLAKQIRKPGDAGASAH